jgi:hypothetical protein
MFATAWFWFRVFALAAGVGAIWLGLSVMDDDDRMGLRYLSCGSAIAFLILAATFWPL